MSTTLADKFEAIVNNELANTLVPIKTKNGIRVGDVEIVSEGNIKNIKIKGRLKFRNVYLNSSAVVLANMLANRKDMSKMKKIYEADQAYGRYFVDSQFLRYHYNMALQDRDSFKVNMFWSRYIDRRDKVAVAKKHVEQLIRS